MVRPKGKSCGVSKSPFLSSVFDRLLGESMCEENASTKVASERNVARAIHCERAQDKSFYVSGSACAGIFFLGGPEGASGSSAFMGKGGVPLSRHRFSV